MKKILFVGKTEGLYRELSLLLSGHYTVHSGSSEPLAIFTVMKRFKPDLIIMNTDEVSEETMSRIGSEYGDIPVIAISAENDATVFPELHARAVCLADTSSISETVYKTMPYSPEDDKRLPVVLVIDDDASTLRMVKAMIEDEFEPFFALSGAKALKLMERKRPDVILLDHEMPEMNGTETLKLIRTDRRFAEIPVIFLTGNISSHETLKSLTELNTAGFLIKPADAPDIKAALNRALGK